MKDPCVLMLGNEDLGLPRSLVEEAQHKVTIGEASEGAQHADVDSLNVSAAAAILINRFLDRPPLSHKIKQDTMEKQLPMRVGISDKTWNDSDALRPKYMGAPKVMADDENVLEDTQGR